MQCLPPVQRWENKADSQSKRKAPLCWVVLFLVQQERFTRGVTTPRHAQRVTNAPPGRFFRFAHTLFESLIQKEKHHPVGWCFFWRSRRDSNSRYAFGVHTISSRYSHFLLFLNTRYSSIPLYFSKLLVYLVSS